MTNVFMRQEQSKWTIAWKIELYNSRIANVPTKKANSRSWDWAFTIRHAGKFS